jgi:serine/threonine-protein kinase
MGEVYRARDTRLGREVAIKVLPAEVAREPERLARFRREAQLLASLNHPHIAAVYGLEELDGKLLLFLELVEGQDLAQRLKRGAIPVWEGLEIAQQIAEALEEAHEHGIVHRDLKPANIKLSSAGKVKVLDFGLAKAYSREDPTPHDLSHTSTLTRAESEPGVILGTAAYMSPEQARGKPVDKRADIWAFGVVLYEMLTGRRLFRGDTTSDTLAAVLKTDPDWSLLPLETPLRIADLLRRCLTRDPRHRWRDMGDVRIELEAARSGAAVAAGSSRVRSTGYTPLLAGALGLAAGAAITWSLARGVPSSVTTSPRRVARFSIALPPSAPLFVDNAGGSALAISRDGAQVAYVTGKQAGRKLRHICSRRLDDLTVRNIPGTEGAFNPFFSPDGNWIAFFTGEGTLNKVALAGGRPITLARGLSNSYWELGVWNDDGRIVFDTTMEGLRMISAAGGPVTVLSRPAGEWQSDPQILPGTDVVLYLTLRASQPRIDALSLDGKIHKTLVDNASHPRYLASGHLLFVRDGGLMVAPFDKGQVDIKGAPVSIPLEVSVDHPNMVAPQPQLAVAADGTLVYAPAAPGSLRSSSLVWVDRRGAVEEAATLPLAVPVFALSPDGGRIAVAGREAGRARIDLFDLSRKTATRLVDQDVDLPTAPLFSPDGRRLFFGLWDTERSELWTQPADGSGPAMRMFTLPGVSLTPSSITPDGRFLAFTLFTRNTGQDVWIADLTAPEDKRARPFCATGDMEWGGSLSPDGRWLAYVAFEFGDPNVYVRRFPQGDGKTRVSIDGGTGPQWSRDGRSLFFQSADGSKLLESPVSATDRGLIPGQPHVLFEGPYLVSYDPGPSYAVSADARRFLMTRQPNLVPLRATELVVVQNWFEEVRRLAPTVQ